MCADASSLISVCVTFRKHLSPCATVCAYIVVGIYTTLYNIEYILHILHTYLSIYVYVTQHKKEEKQQSYIFVH